MRAPELFDAIIFDCDGVLVDSEVLAIRGERASLAEFGLVYTPEDYVRRFVGMHDRMFFDHLRQDYRAAHGAPAPDDFEARVLEGPSVRLPSTLPARMRSVAWRRRPTS